MLLGNKKAQNNDQNWCVVLNTIPSEIGKNQISRRLGEVFSLSVEEAADVVNNTPIIILDNLTQQVADKVKEYFGKSGADIILTNDVIRKRKYYRTVWPEAPSLTFLQDFGTPENTKSATEESKALAPDEALHEIRSINSKGKKPVALPKVDGSMKQELEDKKRECQRLREEVSRLHADLEKREQNQAQPNEALARESAAEIQRKNHEIDKAQQKVSEMEDRYETLKEEYRQARSLFEEKFAESKKVSDDWKVKVAQLTSGMGERHQERREFEEKIEEYQKQLQESQARFSALQEETSKLRATHDEAKEERNKAEERLKDLEKSQLRLIKDFEGRSKEAHDWEIRCLEIDKQMVELKENYANKEKILEVNLKQLEIRERELQNMKRELVESQRKLTDQESYYKRMIHETVMAEKDARLKKLVEQQQQIEDEVREREDKIRNILMEQAAVEKEIMEEQQSEISLESRDLNALSGRLKIQKSEEADSKSSEDSETHN